MKNSIANLGIIMNGFFQDIPLFVEIGRHKSFSKASEVLDISASTLSRRIRALEKDMGILLFYRDTRNVELTPSGALLFERCEYILNEARDAYASALWNMREPSGLIRVFMYVDTYNAFMEKVLSGFLTRWPDIRMDVRFGEEFGDMRTEPYDVAFLANSPVSPDTVARRLLTIEPYVWAAPSLFERHPVPRVPEDLARLPCIILDRFGRHWPLRMGDRQITQTVNPTHTLSSVKLCIEFALAGLGVAMIRKTAAAAHAESGRLVRVLPDWEGPRHDLKLVTGPGQLPHRVRLFVDYMLNHYASIQELG